MTTFIRTLKGMQIRLHQVAQIAATESANKYTLTTVSGERHMISCDAIAHSVVNMIPAEGWELLGVVQDDHGRPQATFAEPIIAWGLNLFGTLIPISINGIAIQSLDWVGIRKAGNPTVYQLAGDTYEDDKQWLADLQEMYDGAHHPRYPSS